MNATNFSKTFSWSFNALRNVGERISRFQEKLSGSKLQWQSKFGFENTNKIRFGSKRERNFEISNLNGHEDSYMFDVRLVCDKVTSRKFKNHRNLEKTQKTHISVWRERRQRTKCFGIE